MFSFDSKRHKEYPFSLTIYINNTYDCRVSTWYEYYWFLYLPQAYLFIFLNNSCEYRHTLNVRIGSKKGKFSFVKVTGDKPCYK